MKSITQLKLLIACLNSEGIRASGSRYLESIEFAIAELEDQAERKAEELHNEKMLFKWTCINNGLNPNFEYNMYLSRLATEEAIESANKTMQ